MKKSPSGSLGAGMAGALREAKEHSVGANHRLDGERLQLGDGGLDALGHQLGHSLLGADGEVNDLLGRC
jgi:hypothetical protein